MKCLQCSQSRQDNKAGMFATVVLILFTSVVVIIGWFYQQKWKYRSISHIPGAPQYPLVGTALEFGLNPVEKLKDFVRLTKTYGTVNRFSIGPNNSYLLISDPELTEFFLSSTRFLTKSQDYDLLRPWIGNGLLTSTGSYWQKRRKVITPTFHFKILDEFVPIFNSGADILVKRLTKEVNKDVVDIYPYVTAYTLDSICETAMSTSVKAQENDDNDYVRAVKTISTIFIDRTFSAWKQFDCLFRFANDYKDHIKSLNTIHNFTTSVIQKRRNEIMTNSSNTKTANNEDDIGIKKRQAFLDLLLNSTIDGKPLSDDDIREEVDTFMFEGHDTTASAIAFAMYELSKNPDVQKKVHDEVNEIFADDKNRDPTLHDLNNMKYLDAVVKETLRLYPSVPLFARSLQEDVTFKGTTYPKGLSLAFFIYYMHRRDDLFKDPETFNPDRFLEKNESKTTHPYAYVPFSAGPRNCIGQKFAMFESKASLSKIIRNLELLPVDPKHQIVLSMETILKSVTGIPVRIRKRV